MTIKMTIMAPFPGLYKAAQEVIEERSAELIGEINVVLLNPMGTGVIEAEKEIAKGTEVIISRGYTASCISSSVEIPVVHIQVTALDIMQALRQVSDEHKKVGVVGFSGVVYECERAGKILGISIQELLIEDEIESIYEVIKKAISAGTSVIIGGASAAGIAIELGIKGVLLESGKNAVYKAIKEAETLMLAQRKGLERARKINTMIESATDEVIISSKSTNITTFEDVARMEMVEKSIKQKSHSKGWIAKMTLDQFIGSSEKIRSLKIRTQKFARTDSTVLITGESGTGKEMLAQSIHNLSKRKAGPFVAINCAALPPNLLESEMFGYEEGAFTGTKKGGKVGLFELAHGGTIFLDEVGEMPLPLQSRLLRVLQEKAVMRLGADCIMPIDVRVIAATNQDLENLIEEKTFRKDLYYRLNILRLYIPPLRERVDDIPELVESFLRHFAHINLEVKGINPRVIRLMQLYSWNGNVRELSNMLERAMLLSIGPMIEEMDIEELLPLKTGHAEATAVPKNYTLQEMESEAIIQMLVSEEFSYTKVAAKLGISRTTLWRKLKGLRIEK
ncbi:MAG: proprionate catabolism activator, Fis family [Firmicutes bacterium]|nr:proprionate catabolism activator, Fis family [Bacillota bacterium]